jgi:sodium/proline symporter
MSLELATFIVYFACVLGVAFLSYRRQKSDTDFLLGNRSLNFWLTALSAHASDMSSWLFLGYPALIFKTGLFSAWAAVGLTLFMFLNWQFIAPRLRVVTEQTNSLTLSSYFENRFSDKTGTIRFVSALISVFFFTVYISSGLNGLGILLETLFNIEYHLGISIGLSIVVLYVLIGGYKTVAWIDLFQGFFLLGVILFIPILVIGKIGGMEPVKAALVAKNLSTSLFPNFEGQTIWQIVALAAGWGLGYFGQPHILTKFMGIRNVSDMGKAKWLGISWQFLALGGATVLGLFGVYFFPNGLADPEQVILEIVKATLDPFFAGLTLCAVLAATTNVMAAQTLYVASNLSEDFYKKLMGRPVGSKELLVVSRLAVLAVGAVAFLIAFFKISTIYQLVLYSWSGLGSAFGPLLLVSLYSKKINQFGALAGILVGGFVAAIWVLLGSDIPSMIPGFFSSLITLFGVSKIFEKRA